MIMISSTAGRRLARARHRYDALLLEKGQQQPFDADLQLAALELNDAADGVAEELIAGGHHETEGD